MDGHPRRVFVSAELTQTVVEVSNLCVPLLLWAPGAVSLLAAHSGPRADEALAEWCPSHMVVRVVAGNGYHTYNQVHDV